MRRLKRKIQNRQYGQAMAEFALTLPIFLLLVFGVIELSRFFLVYSSVFTAVREATRYGSSVGDQANPNYQNCEMITETAVRMGNFGGVQTEDVIVYFESEPGTWVADCNPDDDPDDRYQPVLGDRVVVEINTNYDSLLGVVPDLTVSAQNGRTIMLGVQSQVAVINTVNPGGEATSTSTPIPTQIPTQTDVPTATPEPTEDTTTPETTEDPSTPEPIEGSTEEVTCPDSSIVEFANGYELSSNNKSLVITLENDSTNSYKLLYMMYIDWTKEAGKKTRYLQSIKSGNTVLYTAVNQSPIIDKASFVVDTVSVSKPKDLELSFNFSEKADDISMSFVLRLSDSNNPLCEYTISFSETGD